jgi:hypothetical protein
VYRSGSRDGGFFVSVGETGWRLSTVYDPHVLLLVSIYPAEYQAYCSPSKISLKYHGIYCS